MIYKELKPIFNHQKSFYGKAKTREYQDRIYLISYNTVVAYIDKRHFVLHKLWNDYSTTTMIHIKEFCRQYINTDFEINKSKWLSMEVD